MIGDGRREGRQRGGEAEEVRIRMMGRGMRKVWSRVGGERRSRGGKEQGRGSMRWRGGGWGRSVEGEEGKGVRWGG